MKFASMAEARRVAHLMTPGKWVEFNEKLHEVQSINDGMVVIIPLQGEVKIPVTCSITELTPIRFSTSVSKV